MIRDRKAFILGMLMLLSFLGIYFYMMSPSFGNGRNGLEFADDMFNSISKGSTVAIVEGEAKKAEKWQGTTIDVEITAKTPEEAAQWASQYQTIQGVQVTVNENALNLKGDLGQIFAAIAQDCLTMYNNEGDVLRDKYNVDPREATYIWYNSSKQISKALDKQENFKASSAIQSLQKKMLEPAYNYYGVETKHVKDNKGTMTFMLVFYMIYTIWYGFAIYYLCQGFGITMSKQAKKAEA
ncbi:hypothetical protein [Desulforamulus ferrireducens]|uniref:Uncharacterized protein n=1 Tax=Desulforamulus ferrireducens TaxID=1833852 RepID=A0A1S6ITQ1_9FIRM|nr:hypothetical protein [Desulforamulus ferrireducens]AQS58156.1 hypothetical protein B0537_03035 [Desulforamulus ferrireducens]